MIETTIKFVQDVIALIGDDAVFEEMEILGWRGHDANDIPAFIEDYIGQVEPDGEGYIVGIDIVQSDFKYIADKYGYSVDENLVVTD